MVFRIGLISMGGQLSCGFGEKPESIAQESPPATSGKTEGQRQVSSYKRQDKPPPALAFALSLQLVTWNCVPQAVPT